MKRKPKKIVFKTKEVVEKQRICVRFTKDMKELFSARANKDYVGRGKQSQLAEDAINYYLFCQNSINWTEYERDNDYLELIDDIHEGLNYKNLGPATQIFISPETYEKLTRLETRVIMSKPELRDARTGIIRKAISIRLSIENKAFFDDVMAMEA